VVGRGVGWRRVGGGGSVGGANPAARANGRRFFDARGCPRGGAGGSAAREAVTTRARGRQGRREHAGRAASGRPHGVRARGRRCPRPTTPRRPDVPRPRGGAAGAAHRRAGRPGCSTAGRGPASPYSVSVATRRAADSRRRAGFPRSTHRTPPLPFGRWQRHHTAQPLARRAAAAAAGRVACPAECFTKTAGGCEQASQPFESVK